MLSVPPKCAFDENCIWPDSLGPFKPQVSVPLAGTNPELITTTPCKAATVAWLVKDCAVIQKAPPLTLCEIVPLLTTLTFAGPYHGKEVYAPITPFWPCIVIPGPIVNVVPP